MRKVILLVLLVLVVASCSGDDDAADVTATTVGSGQTSTTGSSDSTGSNATTTTSPATTTTMLATTTTTTSTTTTVAPGPGVLALTRVVFAPAAYVTITNVGNGPVELGSHWLCQRPAYVQLPSLELAPGDTVAIKLGQDAPPDLVEYVAVLEVGGAFGTIVRADGELALYTDPVFNDAAAILDYVEWGSSGHGRSAVAVEAGIWVDGAFVEVPPEAMSISSSGSIGSGPEDWFADLGG